MASDSAVDIDQQLIEYIALSGQLGRSMTDLHTLLTQSQPDITMDDVWARLLRIDDVFVNKQPASDSTPCDASARWTASLARQQQYLYRGKVLALPASQQSLLETIGAAGAQGMPQCIMTKVLSCRAQAVSHNIKRLVAENLIVKARSVYNGTPTNTCFHRHYMPDPSSSSSLSNTPAAAGAAPELVESPIDVHGNVRYDITVAKINQALDNAKNKILVMTDLIHQMGFTSDKHIKWAKTFLQRLHQDGYVEKLYSSPFGHRLLCVRLIKPIPASAFESSNSTKTTNSQQASTSSSAKGKGKLKPLTPDDLIAVVRNFGNRGATNKDLLEAFPDHGARTVTEAAQRIRDDPASPWTTTKELQHKSTIYRYFAKHGPVNDAPPTPAPATAPAPPLATAPAPAPATAPSPTKAQTPATATATTTASAPTPATAPAQAPAPVPATTGGEKRSSDQAFDDAAPAATRSGGSETKKRVKRTANNRSQLTEKRMEALLRIVQRDGVRDFGKELFSEVQQAATDGKGSQHMSQSTAERLVDYLRPDNVVHLVKVPIRSLAGALSVRTLIMLREMDEKHEIVQAHLQKSKTRDIERNRQMFTSNNTNGSLRHMDSIDMDVSPSTATQKGGRKTPLLPVQRQFLAQSRRYIAIRHGWLASKWIRARELHLYLFQHTNTQTPMPLAALLRNLPLNLYLKIIGVQRSTPALAQFLEKNDQLDMPIDAVPDRERHELLISVSHFRTRLRMLLEILQHLDLIHVENDPEPVYRCSRVGIIRNYNLLLDPPVLSEQALDTVSAVHAFWRELQFTCTCIYPNDKAGRTRNAHLTREERHDRRYTLATITRTSTWIVDDNDDLITEEQKKCLDEHVDYQQQRILDSMPHHDWGLCRKLSRETGLLPLRIRSYYINLDNSFQKRENSPARLINPIHDKPKQPTPPPPQDVTKIPQVLRDLVRASKENTPISTTSIAKSTQSSSSSPPPMAKMEVDRKAIVQTRFNASDHHLFLHATAIMRHRARHSRFYWHPITQVLPNKTLKQCIDHFRALKQVASPELDKLYQLTLLWADMYDAAVASGQIDDPKPWDVRNYNLFNHVEFFLKELMQKPNEPDYVKFVPLQHDMTPVVAMYAMRRARPAPLSPGIPSKYQRDLRTLALETRARPLPWLNPDPPRIPRTFDAIRLHTAINVVKMIAMLPEDRFDSHAVYQLLSQFTQKQVEDAYHVLMKQGFLAITKHDASLRVPGRKYRVARMFLASLGGPFDADVFEGAAECASQLMDGQPVPSDVDGSTLLCLADMFSQGKVSFVPHDEQAMHMHMRTCPYSDPATEHATLLQRWTDMHDEVDVHVESSVHDDATATTTIMMAENDEWTLQTVDQVRTSLLRSALTPGSEGERLWMVYDALASFGEQGALPMEIKSALHKRAMKMTTAPLDDTTLTRLIKALAQLRVIVLVGVDDRRWVCIHLAKPWFIQTTNAGFVQPRPWMDLQGKNEQQHVRAIADQGVLAQIVHRPGISKEALHAATRTQWTLGDLDDILSRLASQGRIQCRTMVKQQPCTVFSKPVYQSLDSQANITVASTSHYWPCHNHYHRTHQ